MCLDVPANSYTLINAEREDDLIIIILLSMGARVQLINSVFPTSQKWLLFQCIKSAIEHFNMIWILTSLSPFRSTCWHFTDKKIKSKTVNKTKISNFFAAASFHIQNNSVRLILNTSSIILILSLWSFIYAQKFILSDKHRRSPKAEAFAKTWKQTWSPVWNHVNMTNFTFFNAVWKQYQMDSPAFLVVGFTAYLLTPLRSPSPIGQIPHI